MNHLQGQGGPPASRQRIIMAANPRFHRSEVDGGAFAQAADKVVCHLGVIDGPWNGLKTEQGHRLLMQLVKGSAAKLTGRT
jgi:hypothetical protein